jgi:hypothetical protein
MTGLVAAAVWRLALEPTGNPDVFVAEPGSNFSGENVLFVRLDHLAASG